MARKERNRLRLGRGKDTLSLADRIAPGRCRELLNFEYKRGGGLIQRLGFFREHQTYDMTATGAEGDAEQTGQTTYHAPPGGIGKPILLARATRPDNTGEWLLGNHQGKLFKQTPSGTAGTYTYSEIAAGLGGTPLSTAQFFRYTVFVSLSGVMKYWDGTSFGTVPAPTLEGIKARAVANMGGQLYAIDVIDGAASRLTNLIRFSDLVEDEIWGRLKSVTITAGGTGYTTATVVISGGGGSGAAATATINGGAIADIEVTNAGSGYYYPPTITVTGDGSGATFEAILSGPYFYYENWILAGEGEALTALATDRRDRYFWTERGRYKLAGFGGNQNFEAEPGVPGCVGPRAVKLIDDALVWISPEYGPVIARGSEWRPMALDTWWDKSLWAKSDLRGEAVVSWNPTLRRALFNFPGMVDGWETNRLWAWFPDAGSNSEYEWYEQLGLNPACLDYGEVGDGREGEKGVDDYGFVCLLDTGHMDGAPPCLWHLTGGTAPYSTVSALAMYGTDYETNLFGAEQDAFAGLYLTTSGYWVNGGSPATEATSTVRRVRITGHNALVSELIGAVYRGRISALALSPALGVLSASGGYAQMALVGSPFLWLETAAADYGDAELRKLWGEINIQQSILNLTAIQGNTLAATLALTTRHDFASFLPALVSAPNYDTFMDSRGANLPGATAGQAAGAGAMGPVFELARYRYQVGGVWAYHQAAVLQYVGIRSQRLVIDSMSFEAELAADKEEVASAG